MVRMELRGVFKSYFEENCLKGGVQKSNLNDAERRGLKSLQKRVSDNEILVVPTDKSGRFAIMTLATYEMAGLAHTKKDVVVPFSEIKSTQTELNGNVSMMIKIFKLGAEWNHGERMRESMLNKSLAVCPLYLLYKDHKGWSLQKGPVPPTRPVASGNRGMNMHLSEIISEILEPVADGVENTCEVVSTEDMIAKMLKKDRSLEGWTRDTWWNGVIYEGYTACMKCVGHEDYTFDKQNPELCSCMEIGQNAKDMVKLNLYSKKNGQKGSKSMVEDVEKDMANINLGNGDVSVSEGKYGIEVVEKDMVRLNLSQDIGDTWNEDLVKDMVRINLNYEEVRGNGSVVEVVEKSRVRLSLGQDVGDEDSVKDMVNTRQNHSGGRGTGSDQVGECHEPANSSWGPSDGKPVKTTINFMKKLREWTWSDITNRVPKGEYLDSTEVRPEMIQDFEAPMELIGCDVNALYPSLDWDTAELVVKNAIMESDIRWENIDILEGCRYIALNWDGPKCRKSKLARILPVRRAKTGVRPGVRGEGPMGPTVHDQEQWRFPDVVITEEERKEVIATVVAIATKVLFSNHLYSFGGKVYRQTEGGAIGLRAICAIARVTMNTWDNLWNKRILELNLKV